MIGSTARHRLFTGVAACALLAGNAWAQDTVGVTSAVNPQATGTPPQRASRTLNIGLDMFRNEKIVTGPEGKTQLLFVDGSALTIGPNSEVVLDEFVYDPGTESGKLSMTATKGVFRLVGGKISKTDTVTLKTPTATLGIRGGIATATVGPNSGFFGFLFGQKMTVDGTGSDGQPTQQVVTRPGTGVPLGPNGTVLAPVPIPQGEINQQLGALEGNRGQSGGAGEQPTDSRVAATGMANLGSANTPTDLVAPLLPPGDLAGLTGAIADEVGLQQASQIDTIAEQSQSAMTPRFGSGFTGRYKSTPGSGFGLGAGQGGASFNRPVFGGLLTGNFVGITIDPSTVSVTDSLDGILFQAPLTGTPLESHPRGSFFSFSSSGTASPFGPIAGLGFASANNDFVFFTSQEVDLSNERSVLIAGIPTPQSAFEGIGGLFTFDIRADAIFGSSLAFILPQYGGNLPGTRSKAYIFGSSPGTPSGPAMSMSGRQTAFLQGNLAISGQGLSQQSAVSVIAGRVVRNPSGQNGLLDGQVRGTFRVNSGGSAGFLTGQAGFAADAQGNGIYGATSPDFFLLDSSGGLNPDQATGEFQATGLPSASGVMPNLGGISDAAYFANNLGLRIDNPAGAGSNRPSQTLNGFFNGFFDRFNPGGTLLSVNNAIETSGGSFTSLQLSFDAGSNIMSGVMVASDSFFEATYNLPFGGTGRSAYIDKDRYAAVESSSSTATRSSTPAGAFLFYLVGNELVSTTGFLPTGVSYCDCPASTFGYWGMDFLRSTGERDRVHLGQFVAGAIPTAAEVPIVGSATYVGHAVADVVRASARYKAAGSFTLSYGFAARFGTWQVTNFDGGTLNGTVSATMGFENKYSGSFTGTFGGDTVSGGIQGAFFRSPTDPVAETGSQFSGSGTVGGLPYSVQGVTQGRHSGITP